MSEFRENMAWRLHALADYFSINCRWMGKYRWYISIAIDRVALIIHV